MHNKEMKVSVILPVINETFSLTKTVELILLDNQKDIYEILIIISKTKTTISSKQIIKKLELSYQNIIKVFNQDLPFIGGAIQKGFKEISGTHVIMMASDLETDPKDVNKLISTSRANPDSIVTANRWLIGGGFHKYNKIKLLLNYFFQNLLKIIYNTNLSDITYGYRIFPSHIVKKISWKELKHPFFLETILKPIKMKTNIIEIPSSWKARLEGESQNNFMDNFLYIKTALMIKFFWKPHTH
jgi:glycosyltransferase involved in cell wall biosynthesis